MPPKELELLSIAVGVEIRASQANADQLDKHPRSPGSCSSSHMSQPRQVPFASMMALNFVEPRDAEQYMSVTM
jgi:hypothetical protein